MARSAEFMQQPHMQVLRWLRVPGDTIFAGGMAAIILFVAGLTGGWSLGRSSRVTAEEDTDSDEAVELENAEKPELAYARAH
jgi:nitric oxide reductase subunit B